MNSNFPWDFQLFLVSLNSISPYLIHVSKKIFHLHVYWESLPPFLISFSSPLHFVTFKFPFPSIFFYILYFSLQAQVAMFPVYHVKPHLCLLRVLYLSFTSSLVHSYMVSVRSHCGMSHCVSDIPTAHKTNPFVFSSLTRIETSHYFSYCRIEH